MVDQIGAGLHLSGDALARDESCQGVTVALSSPCQHLYNPPMARALHLDVDTLQAALIGLERRRDQIDAKVAEIRRRIGTSGKRPAAAAQAALRRRQLSAAARERIVAAQKKRWEAFRRQREEAEERKPPTAKAEAKQAAVRKPGRRPAAKKAAAKKAAVRKAAKTKPAEVATATPD